MDNITNGVPTPEDLALIHKYTRTALAEQDVYVFQTVLCDNEIDRDGEQFSAASLEKMAALFLGKTGLFDHSGKSGDQVMRIYATSLDRSAERRNSLGEPYIALMAKVYLLRNGANAALIGEIDGGIKKEVSVSCAVKRVACSVCGNALRGCGHKKGEVYDGRRCHAILEEPTDAYEFSFVAIPAQPGAGVVKRKKSRGGAHIDTARLEELERLAEDGRAYREQLLAKTMRAGGVALPGIAHGLWGEMCAPLNTAQLAQLWENLESCAAKALPLTPQLAGYANGGGAGEFAFRG